ncbi:MAG: hypothetical protein ABJC62_03665 [Frankiaceae bacterium]
MRDLAPTIVRQRLVIEGTVTAPITATAIVEYLRGIGGLAAMRVLTEPVTHLSPLYGWAGWVHWETSGAHFYAWNAPDLFFSVDMYACKVFQPEVIVEFTRRFFSATDVVSHGF